MKKYRKLHVTGELGDPVWIVQVAEDSGSYAEMRDTPRFVDAAEA